MAIVAGVLVVVLAALVYVPLTLLAPPDPARLALTARNPGVPPAAQLAFPGYGESAVGAVGWKGTLATSGPQDAVPIASISKVVTSLVVLERHPLAPGEQGPTLRFDETDRAYYGRYLALDGKVLPMPAGLELTQLQTMQMTLIESANNYAAALARWAFGSQDAFVAAAQSWLASHGLAHMTIVEPTGIDPRNTSTPADLVELGKLALANPVLAALVSTATTVVPGVGTITNTNALLGAVEPGGITVDGVKTGTLDTAGADLLFSADLPVGSRTVTVVGVVLGAVDHDVLDADVPRLLASVRAGFHEVALATKGEVLGTYRAEWGASAPLVATATRTAVLWSDARTISRVHAQRVRIGTRHERVGTLTVAADATRVVVPLELGRAIRDPGPWWRLTHPADLLDGR